MAAQAAKAARVALAGGRALAFREYGDAAGVPIIFAHGNLNSRCFAPCWDKTDEITREAGVRLIAIDRPGYGLSSPYETRSYQSFTRDIDALATHLGLDRFVVAGYSSGGPHALACAASAAFIGQSLFDKVAGVCLISSDGPYTLMGDEHIERGYGERPPITEAYALERAEANHASMRASYEAIPKLDKRAACLADLDAAVAQGIGGAAADILLETSPWGFALADVAKPVRMWHGDQDHDVPLACAEFIRAGLPAALPAALHVLPGENHTLLRRHWAAILADARRLVAAPAKADL